MFINVRVCFLDTVKSIKLSRKMFFLLSKDDRCRFYLLRLLVEGVLEKVKLNSQKNPDNHSLHTITIAVYRCLCQPLWTVKTGLAAARLEPKILEAAYNCKSGHFALFSPYGGIFQAVFNNFPFAADPTEIISV